MADYSGIFAPPPPTQIQTSTVTTLASSAEIVIGSIGPNARIAIAVSGNANIKFGNAGMTAASAADLPLWGSSTSMFTFGHQYTSVRIFNSTGSTITYWIWPMYT